MTALDPAHTISNADELCANSKPTCLSSLSSRLRLLQFASQALPTGAFAYSSGLESLHAMGHLHNEAQCISYLTTLMENSVAHLELPLFLRMRSALHEGNTHLAHRESMYLLASRESRELQEQEQQMGRALYRVLSDLHPDVCAHWQPHTFSEALAQASCLYQLDEQDAATLLVYTWLEQQVSSLCRMIPLGPIAGQRVLDAVLSKTPEVIVRGQTITEDQIGASAPILALASALHETQYTRIFRS